MLENTTKAEPTSSEIGIIASITKIDKNDWHKIIDQFLDANLYQTFSYDAVRGGQKNIDHLVIKQGEKFIAVAQVRKIYIRVLGAKIAYVRWGPLWKKTGEDRENDNFRHAVRALRYEYVEQQHYILRIVPVLFREKDQELSDILYDEGFKELNKKVQQRTILVNLQPDLEEIRRNLAQKWRNQLNQAEKRGIEIVEGDSDQLFEAFISLYQELVKRKEFRKPNDINEYRLIQKDLPQEFKMRIFLAKAQEGIGAGAICSALGNKGIFVFGASNPIGMACKGSYMVHWRIVQWLKEKGCIWYDLNGINPKKNPGTYHFKAGLAGKNGRELSYRGPFECYGTIKNFVLSVAENYYINHVANSRVLGKIKMWIIKKR